MDNAINNNNCNNYDDNSNDNNDDTCVVRMDIDDDDDDTLDVSLRNIIPCNLRDDVKFLTSRIDVTLSKTNLRLFLRCYGFLMHDRAKKVAALKNNPNSEVREIASLLAECTSLRDFKLSLSKHLEYIKTIIEDPMAVNALTTTTTTMDSEDITVDDDDDATATDPRTKRHALELDILQLAKESLESVFAFIRDSDHLRRNINADEYCRAELFKYTENKKHLAVVYSVWNNVTSCNVDECLSILLRDVFVTSGLQTKSTLLFVVRVCLVLTYLVANFMHSGGGGGGDTRAVRISVPILEERHDNDDVDDEYVVNMTAEYWQTHANVTVDKFIATTIVSMTRLYIAECIDWPHTVYAAATAATASLSTTTNTNTTINTTTINTTIPLDNILNEIIKGLNAAADTSKRSKTLKWLHATRRKVVSDSHHSGGGARRLYVKYGPLLGLFEHLSKCIIEPAASSSYLESNILPQKQVTVRISSPEYHLYWQEFNEESDICSNAIVRAIDERATAAATTAAICSSGSSNTANGGGGVLGFRSFEQFVTCTNGPFRDASDDIAELAQHCRQTEQDEIDVLRQDVASLLLHTVLSLVRYAPDGTKVYDSLTSMTYTPESKMFNDELYESHVLLLVHTMSQLYRAKMTTSQARAFLCYLTRMWHTQIGIVTLEQLSEILLTVCEMFKRRDTLSATTAIPNARRAQ